MKTRVMKKKKSWFDSNNNERKHLLTPVSPSVQACSHSSMRLSSPLSYINKIKNYIKGKEEPRLNLYKNLFYSLLNSPSASDVWGIYSIEMDKKTSQKIGELAISEFESSPCLQIWFDVNIQF